MARATVKSLSTWCYSPAEREQAVRLVPQLSISPASPNLVPETLGRAISGP